jgi:NitT/TauT family transport system substrate-binding protein
MGRFSRSHLGDKMSPGLALLALMTCAALFPLTARAEGHLVIASAASGPTTGSVFMAVADKAGFLKEENLTVDIRYTSGGPVAVQLIGSNNADIGEVSFEPAVVGYLNGVRGKFIFSTWTSLIYRIGVLAGSPIRSVTDLKDKKIGAPNVASAAVIIAKSILRNAKVPVSDASFLPVGLGAGALAALKTEKIDAYASFTSAFAVFARSGVELRYFDHPTAAHIGNGGFFVSEEAIRQKPKELAGYLRAMAKTYAFIAANPEASMRLLWAKYPQTRGEGSDAEAMKAALAELKVALISYDIAPPADKKYGEFDLDSVKTYFQILREEHFIDSEVSPSVLITNDFVTAANDFDREAVKRLAQKWPR